MAIAIFCALRHHDDFSEGIIAAVNHDGDSDSTGAIAGNILGAHLGYSAIDDKWKKDLELADVILELSGDLCRKCQMHEHGPQYDSVWMDKYGCAVPHYVIRARKQPGCLHFSGVVGQGKPFRCENAFRPLFMRVKRLLRWSQVRDSNPRPAHYE